MSHAHKGYRTCTLSILVVFWIFNWSLVDLQDLMSFGCPVQWLNNYIHCGTSPREVSLPSVTTEGHDNTVDCIPCAVLFILVTPLLYNWKFVSLDPLPLHIYFFRGGERGRGRGRERIWIRLHDQSGVGRGARSHGPGPKSPAGCLTLWATQAPLPSSVYSCSS